MPVAAPSILKQKRSAWIGAALAALMLICGAADGGGPRTQADRLFATSRQVLAATVPAKVLIAGGFAGIDMNGYPLFKASGELYNPATGKFTQTGSMSTARADHTATALQNGKVLVASGQVGWDQNNFPVTDILTVSAELYSPTSGKFSKTGSMSTARIYQTATALRNGSVLVAGGFVEVDVNGGPISTASAELCNPTSGKFSKTGSMTIARFSHASALLQNGMVLICGGLNYPRGNDLASTELYNPTSGKFGKTGSMTTARDSHTATLLSNGKVLVAGGFGESGNDLSSAELYNPTTGKFSKTGSMSTARIYQTATALQNGKVLVAGGIIGYDMFGKAIPTASAELYNPTTGKFTSTGSMTTARDLHAAALLQNGMVLISGGLDNNRNDLASAELYNPTTGKFTSTGGMTTARDSHTATLLQ